MTNESSIKYLSCLLEQPATITDGDESSIAVFRQTFPYFIPIRYLEAVEQNKRKAFSPEMLTTMHSYIGNWMQFCDFLEAGNKEYVPAASEQSTGSTEDFFQLRRGEVPETAPVSEVISAPVIAQEVVAEKPVIPETIVNEPPVIENIPVPEQPTPVAEVQNNVPQPDELDNEAKDENEIIQEITNAQAEPEPIVAVSEAFLQMIREEGLEQSRKEEEKRVAESVHVAPAPVAIVPQPVITPEEPVQPEPTPAPVAAVYTGPEVIQPEEIEVEEVVSPAEKENPLIYPIYTQDYFLQQGEKVPDEMPAEIDDLIENIEDDEDKSLMVVMSFSEWLLHFKNTSRKQEEEKKDQKALKTMWQKEKLAAAIEEENEEIPENVFEMAVNSITKEDGLASESLAEIYIKQGKYDKAIDMYRKLSLRNPQKNAYFARKIEEVLKEKQS